MSKGHLARSRTIEQLCTWALSVSTCCLSFYFTLCFMRHLWPSESLLVVGTFGGVWELGKLQFGPRALMALSCHERERPAAHVALLALTACLMLGSIIASIGHIAFSYEHERAETQVKRVADDLRAAQASDAYRSTQHALASLDVEIDALSASMAHDMRHHFRTRAGTTATALATLRDRRDAAAAELARIRSAPSASPVPFDLFVNMAALLPGDAQAHAHHIKMTAHIFLAVMLELVGIAAWSVSRQNVQHDTTEPMDPSPDPHPNRVHGHTAEAQVTNTAPVVPHLAHSCAVPGTSPGARYGTTPHNNEHRVQPQSIVPKPASKQGFRHEACTAEKYAQALRLAAACTLVPNHRWLRRHLRVGQQTAQAFLQQLCLDGYIERAGRKYTLTQAVQAPAMRAA